MEPRYFSLLLSIIALVIAIKNMERTDEGDLCIFIVLIAALVTLGIMAVVTYEELRSFFDSISGVG